MDQLIEMRYEKMDEEPNNNTEPIEITKARSRVTANTPAFSANPPYFLFL
jgi:hypothetical protein